MERVIIRDLRKDAGLTQKELAKEFGISTVYLRKIEKGERRPSNNIAIKYVQKFGMTADKIFPDIYSLLIDTKSIKEN